MTCHHLDLGGGNFAVVCTRGRRRRAPCSACGIREHERLCDFPLRGKKAGRTCSIRLCAKCAVTVSGLDYCPAHARHLPVENSAPMPPQTCLPLPEPRPPGPLRARIFDHLGDEPEYPRFSRVAREMRAGELWLWPMPKLGEPAPLSGEITEPRRPAR